MESFSQTFTAGRPRLLRSQNRYSALHNESQESCATHKIVRRNSANRRKIFANNTLARIVAGTQTALARVPAITRVQAGKDHRGTGTISPHEAVIKSETGTGNSCFVTNRRPRAWCELAFLDWSLSPRRSSRRPTAPRLAVTTAIVMPPI